MQVRIFLRLSSNYTVRPGQLSGTRRHVGMLMIIDALRAGGQCVEELGVVGEFRVMEGAQELRNTSVNHMIKVCTKRTAQPV